MITRKIGRLMTTAALIAALWILPLAAIGQTQITAPKNKYKVQQDVEIGNKTAIEVERQFPVLNDRDATDYVSRVGERLVASIPPQFREPQFDYRFKIVNARDLNALRCPAARCMSTAG
jgi:predicted Zn-dependent protease